MGASTNSEKERLKKVLENSESENRRLKSESDKLRSELSSISNGSLNSTVNDDLVNMLKDSHEMIKKHNQKLETDLAKLKSKYPASPSASSAPPPLSPWSFSILRCIPSADR